MSRSDDETVPRLKLVDDDSMSDDMDPKERLGAMIRSARIRKEMSLRELGEAVSMDLTVLGEIERGRRPATRDQIRDLSEVLGVHDGPLMAAAQLWHKAHWRGNGELTLEPDGMKVATMIPPAYRVAQLEDELDRCVIDITLARDSYLTFIKSYGSDELLSDRDSARIVVARDQMTRLGSAAKRAMSIRHENYGQPSAQDLSDRHEPGPGSVECGHPACEAAGECDGHTETPG